MERYFVQLFHDQTNPTVWVVTLYKRGFPFRKKIESKWFISEESAKAYVDQLKYKFNIK